MANTKKFVTKNGLQTQNIRFISGNHIIDAEIDATGKLKVGNSVDLLMLQDAASGVVVGLNDMSGKYSISIDKDGTMRLAETSGNVLVGTSQDNNTDKLQVQGSIYVSGTAKLDNIKDVKKVAFNKTANETVTEGEIAWNANDGTLDLGLSGSSKLQLGQELMFKAHNGTGATIANGSVVRIIGSNNGVVSVELASAANAQGSTIAVSTQELQNGSTGYVTIIGAVGGIDTSSFSEGASLWLSDTVAGQLTATKPSAPNHSVKVGVVTRAHASEGTIHVKVSDISSDAKETMVETNNFDKLLSASETTVQLALDKLDDHNHDAAYEPKNANIQGHIVRQDNPHNVTKAQVGLGNVDNTSDVDKPVSTAMQSALDTKLGKNDRAIDSAKLDGQIPSFYRDWNNTINKPGSFPPDEHTHPISEVTGLQAALNLKLDASAYTANDVLSKLVTVDGSGSNVDADLLDGQHGTYYLNYNNLTNKPTSFPPGTHTHPISQVTNLQTELDSKLNKAGDTMTGNLVMNSELHFESGESRFTYNDGGGNFNQRFGNYFSSGDKYYANNMGAIQVRYNYESSNPEILFRLSEVNTNAVKDAAVVWNRTFKLASDGIHWDNNLVFHDGYHPNADKWTTARTISLTGDASGGVNIDGSSNVNLPVTIAASDILTKIKTVDGPGSGLNADLLDNLDSNAFVRRDTNGALLDSGAEKRIYQGWTDSGEVRYFLAPSTSNGTHWDWQKEFWFNSTQGYWGVDTEFYIGINKRAFHDDYHPNADTLTTPRTIALTGDVTGSVSFNGSQDVSITTTVADDSHNHDSRYLQITGGALSGPLTMNSDLRFQNEENRFTYNDGGGNFNMRFGNKFDSGDKYIVNNTGAIHMRYMYEGGFPYIEFKLSEDSANATAGSAVTYANTFTMGNSGFLINGATAFHDNYHPNADKLTTARTITLAGDVTGSTSFDGSGNVTITATVGNDSHTHDNRYLQLAGGTMSGAINAAGINSYDNSNTPTGVNKFGRDGTQHLEFHGGAIGSFITGTSSTGNAKHIVINSTTNATNDAPTAGANGIDLQVRGTNKLQIGDSNSIFTDSVGIGGVTPSKKLHIESGGYDEHFRMSRGANYVDLKYSTTPYLMFAFDGTDAARVDAAGTSAPHATTIMTREKADNRFVNKTGDTMTGMLKLEYAGYPQIQLKNANDAIDPNDYWIMENNDAGYFTIMRRDDSASAWQNQLRLYTDKVYFGQNVGVKTTDPKEELSVIGNIINSPNAFFGTNTYYNSGWKYDTSGYAGYMKISDSNGDFSVLSTNGSGTADAAATMVNRMRYDVSANKWSFYTSGTEQFTITDSDTVNNNSFKTNNVYWGTATGGGHVGVMSWNGDRLYIAPTNKSGGYEWGKELTYNPDGDAIWTAEGGFKTTGDLFINTTKLSDAGSGAGNALRVTTPSGYVDIGPRNTSWSHFTTDRSKFYFNKEIHVDGSIFSYNQDLILSRDASTTARLRVTNGTTYSDQKFEFAGDVDMTTGSVFRQGGSYVDYKSVSIPGASTKYIKIAKIKTGVHTVEVSNSGHSGHQGEKVTLTLDWASAASGAMHPGMKVQQRLTGQGFGEIASYHAEWIDSSTCNLYVRYVNPAPAANAQTVWFKISGQQESTYEEVAISTRDTSPAGAAPVISQFKDDKIDMPDGYIAARGIMPTSGFSPGVYIGQTSGDDGQVQIVGSSAHIDFAGSSTDDYDIRLIRAGDDALRIDGGVLQISSTSNDALNFTGSATSTHRGIAFNNKSALTHGNDTWLRLNSANEFSSGVYTPGNLRVDGILRIDTDRGLTNVTGDYGSVQTSGDGIGGWEGYNINGRAVFMHDGASVMGLYDDVNNHWAVKHIFNGATELYYDNSRKLLTQSWGVSFAGSINVQGNVDLDDGRPIRFGSGRDYNIHDNGTSTYLRSYRHGGHTYFQGENSGGTNQHLIILQDNNYVRLFSNNSEKLRTESSGVRVYGDLKLNNTTDFIEAREIRTNGGQQLVLAAGESAGTMSHANMGGEYVYTVAENGLKVISSRDNWGAEGWGGRREATICDSDGNSTFPQQVRANAGIIAGADTYGSSPNDNVPGADGSGIKLNGGGVLYIQKTASAGGTSNMIRGYHGTTHTFNVNTNGNVTNTNNSYGALSDKRRKKNITDVKSQWDDIKNLRLINFDWKHIENAPRQMGVIAQEIEKVSPGVVQEDEDGFKNVKYSILYMKSIKALQEAQERIEVLEEKLSKMEELEKRLDAAGL